MLKYEYAVAKSKHLERESQASTKDFISAQQLVTDLRSISNAEDRKSISKFSGLRLFLVFEDLCNGEGSLEANETSKNIRI